MSAEILSDKVSYKINQNSETHKPPDIEMFFSKFNFHAKQELVEKKMRYDFQGLSDKFKRIVTVNGVIASVHNDEYSWKDIM